MKPTRGTIRSLRERGDEAIQRAGQNLDRWGLQTPAILSLCMGEELGEICRAILAARGIVNGEIGKPEAEFVARVRDEALDLGALCLQLAVLCDVSGAPGVAYDEERSEEGVTR